MNAINYTNARRDLAATMEAVCRDRDPVIITKNDDCAVVMISLKDYESLAETDYLLRSQTNAKRLRRALKAVDRGEGVAMSMDQFERQCDEKSTVLS